MNRTNLVRCLAIFTVLAAVAAGGQNRVWYRVVSSDPCGITGITPDGIISWTNETPWSESWLERSCWGDGFWSRNFAVTNQLTNGVNVQAQCHPAHAPSGVEVCTHNLFLIQKSKWDYFGLNGSQASSVSDLISVGLPWPMACPDGGLYAINPLPYDPACSLAGLGHTI